MVEGHISDQLWRPLRFPLQENFSMADEKKVRDVMISSYIGTFAFDFRFAWDAVVRYPFLN